MTPQCHQSLDTGDQCNAPAVNGSKFCRHHDPQRPRKERKDESPETEPLVLPPLLDNYSILIAVNEVVQALTESRIKRSVANTLLSAIKLAVRLVKEIDQAGPRVNTDSPRLQLEDHKNNTPDQHRHITAIQKGSAEVSKPRSTTAPKSAQPVARLADLRQSHPNQPSDRFIEDLIAQSHALLDKAPKPDPRFLRA